MSVHILNERVKSKIEEIVDIKHNAKRILDETTIEKNERKELQHRESFEKIRAEKEKTLELERRLKALKIDTILPTHDSLRLELQLAELNANIEKSRKIRETNNRQVLGQIQRESYDKALSDINAGCRSSLNHLIRSIIGEIETKKNELLQIHTIHITGFRLLPWSKLGNYETVITLYYDRGVFFLTYTPRRSRVSKKIAINFITLTGNTITVISDSRNIRFLITHESVSNIAFLNNEESRTNFKNKFPSPYDYDSIYKEVFDYAMSISN